MTHFFTLTTLAVLTCTCVHAQHTEKFTVTLPESKITNSLYNSIKFIDSRQDTANLGIVQTGAFNRQATVLPATPLDQQLTDVLNAYIDNTAAQGELLFNLRQFAFAELTGAMSEKGYCYMRAELYAKNADQYQKLSVIDTVLLTRGIDVTNALFRKGSQLITNPIAASLTQRPDASAVSYSLNDVMHMDSVEKSTIKLFTTPAYTNGVYMSYDSFKNQVPEKQIAIAFLNGNTIETVNVPGKDGKMEKLNLKEAYAVVYNDKPYIATKKGYVPLKKIDNDLVFTGRAKVTADAANVIGATVFFGIIGGLIASNAEATFEMKIDHLNGGFIRLREVPKETK